MMKFISRVISRICLPLYNTDVAMTIIIGGIQAQAAGKEFTCHTHVAGQTNVSLSYQLL